MNKAVYSRSDISNAQDDAVPPLAKDGDSPNMTGSQQMNPTTSQLYLPFIVNPFFSVVSFSTTGPAYAVPAIDEQFIYVGSGFGSRNCFADIGEVRAFDKYTLELKWKATVAGAIGDTNLTLVNDLLIFGAGNGVAALRTQDGNLAWQLHLSGCFQESFIRFHNDRIFIGSDSGHIYALTASGQILWSNRLPATVFAAPAVSENTLFFVDMSNTLTAVNSDTGQIIWQKTITVDPDKKIGIFASPLLHDNALFIATYAGDVWRVSLEGELQAQHSTNARYVASPTLCDNAIIAANLEGQVDWLTVESLTPQYSLTLESLYLFGTPQCNEQTLIVTTYGQNEMPSMLYYLQAGQIKAQIEFPCCKHALTTTVVDAERVYNVLTTYSGQRQAMLVRSTLSNSAKFLPTTDIHLKNILNLN